MKKIESIDYWHKLIVSGTSFDPILVRKMYKSLETEYPMVSTMMLEQTCNLDCEHCFFKPERSSTAISAENQLETILENIALQLPKNASIVDGGRILRQWHIPLLEKLRLLRKDISIGVVDNGSYLHLKEKIYQSSFRFDWMDISIDGTKEFHNKQRRSTTAYAEAIKGLEHARNFIVGKNKGGKITSLFSASKINYSSLAKAAEHLFERKLVDEFHITPVSPVFRNTHVIMEKKEFTEYWSQMKQVFEMGRKYGVEVFTRIYQAHDIELLATVVGKQKILHALQDVENISVGRGCIRFVVDNVPVIYVPLSICPSETFFISPDGYYRLAYSIQFTLNELHKGISANGENTKPYTVAKIKNDSQFTQLYKQGAIQWKNNFGMQYLKQEFDLFNSFKS